MPLTIQTDPVPLRAEGDGTIRVGRSGVLLETVVREYENGMNPQTMVEEYDTLDLADVFGAISYYLRHRQEVEEYLHTREAEAAEARCRLQAVLPPLPPELQARLEAAKARSGSS